MWASERYFNSMLSEVLHFCMCVVNMSHVIMINGLSCCCMHVREESRIYQQRERGGVHELQSTEQRGGEEKLLGLGSAS